MNIEELNIELMEIEKRLNGDFINPKDVRRKDEILSLLMTEGTNKNLTFKIVKGRGYKKGLNNKKPYYKKGKIE